MAGTDRPPGSRSGRTRRCPGRTTTCPNTTFRPAGHFEPSPRAQRALVAWFSNTENLMTEALADDPHRVRAPCLAPPLRYRLARACVHRGGPTGLSEPSGWASHRGTTITGLPTSTSCRGPIRTPESLPEFEGPGYWHTEDWVGLMLPSAELIQRADADQRATANAFLSAAIASARSTLE